MDVKVKPLVWRERPNGDWRAHTIVGCYDAGRIHSRFWAMLRYVDPGAQDQDHVVLARGTLEAAQAAAQADYESRVLSALEPA
jgi:hypothetical protein